MADENKNGFSLFGFEIQRKIDKQNDNNDNAKRELISFIPDDSDEGDVTTIGANAYFGQYYDIAGDDGGSSEKDLILKYRQAAEQPEVDAAILDIVDESIASLPSGPSIKLILDELNYDDPIKDKIFKEFNHILKLLNFSENGADLFKRWYIDGRLYFHVVVDRKKPNDGIFELRLIDPMRLKRAKEIKEEIDKVTGAKIDTTVEEFYIYMPNGEDRKGFSYTNSNDGLRIAKDAIIEVNSGIMDADRRRRISHLHKALKVVNQLRIMEDALVIYRLARAPERRIFYIDTGNLPKGKAEEYLRSVMSQYRNKIVYDVKTGDIRDERRHMSMLEDFWLPRREGSSGTEIQTLPGGENLGQIDDILYFKNQLYKSLNIPQSRIDPEAAFPGGSGRATEISRDEVKFQKFINRLRKKFSYLFLNALKTQLQLKGIVAESDWEDIVQDINVDFVQDNHFYELKEFEIMQDRINMLETIQDQIGKYYSEEWVRKNILKQSEEEISRMAKQIAAEKEAGGGEEDDLGF